MMANETPKLDLSKLPEPLRLKVQSHLDKLPDDMRQRLLEHGAPMLDRLLERAQKSEGFQPKTPTKDIGHFNSTVQQGDRSGVPFSVVVLIVLGLAVLYYRYFATG